MRTAGSVFSCMLWLLAPCASNSKRNVSASFILFATLRSLDVVFTSWRRCPEKLSKRLRKVPLSLASAKSGGGRGNGTAAAARRYMHKHHMIIVATAFHIISTLANGSHAVFIFPVLWIENEYET